MASDLDGMRPPRHMLWQLPPGAPARSEVQGTKKALREFQVFMPRTIEYSMHTCRKSQTVPCFPIDQQR